jgi:hypothetical protein
MQFTSKKTVTTMLAALAFSFTVVNSSEAKRGAMCMGSQRAIVSEHRVMPNTECILGTSASSPISMTIKSESHQERIGQSFTPIRHADINGVA